MFRICGTPSTRCFGRENVAGAEAFHCEVVTPATTASEITATTSRKRTILKDGGRRSGKTSSAWNGIPPETSRPGRARGLVNLCRKKRTGSVRTCGTVRTTITGSPDGGRAAHAKQMIQPTSVQPNKKFSAKINQRFCCLRKKATRAGAK